MIESARRVATKVLIETSRAEDALRAQAAGCDGVVVKGHEAGGAVGALSSFVLLQRLHGAMSLPWWIQGGAGLATAAAASIAGAGLVLCEQCWLAAESPFPERARRTWARLDGTEPVLAGTRDACFRFLDRSGGEVAREIERAIAAGDDGEAVLRRRVREGSAAPVGQDVAFADRLAEEHHSVEAIVRAYRRAARERIRLAATQRVPCAGSDMARALGTRYPIVQGPMTRVSDNVAFARDVARAGGLPFLALALMRGGEVRRLLRDAHERLGNLPWGVGVLGFLPPEIQEEQLPILHEMRPPCALIAGGQPVQAASLEAHGIPTWLHAPSPALLGLYVRQGARRFVLEGSECGGHTGPRSSFVLWDQAVRTLLDEETEVLSSLQILFAGGIHDALSSAMVAAIAAPLVERGARVGILMGTAYLFTEEAVRSGALLEEYQRQAVACDETVLLRAGVGYTTRCARSAVTAAFEARRRQLVDDGLSEEDVRWAMELFNVGRLRTAAKGVVRNPEPRVPDGGDRHVEVDVEVQRREGLYMLGDAATLRSETTTVAGLHASVSDGAAAVLRAAAAHERPGRTHSTHGDVAIVGRACILPGGSDVRSFWRSVAEGRSAIREVSDDRWRPDVHYTTDRDDRDRVYAKWGAFVDAVPFDPTDYGIAPISMRSIEPLQLLAVEVSRRALEDARAHGTHFPPERTAVVFGAGGTNDLQSDYVLRALLRHYLPRLDGVSEDERRRVLDALDDHIVPWTEDTFPGTLMSLIAGRVANRLDLKGGNFVVDAACAASLAALEAGVLKLRAGQVDVALVGGADGTNNIIGFTAFARTHALSPRGVSQPFDDGADGIVMGEGVAAVVLKRLEDAERDGNRIHAVLKGVGSSSDGRQRSLVAPYGPGQLRALRRAYDDAGVDPASVELIEAHGTGTAVGDPVEIDALTRVLGGPRAQGPHCALGSVKSMVGHTKMAAGLAGVLKATLALQQRVLPPTLGVETPNRRVDFAKTPLYVNSETRPWIGRPSGAPRRCGVSAFGFGGTNFHAVLEEYRGDAAGRLDLAPRPVELFTFERASRAELLAAVADLARRIRHPDALDVGRLAVAHHAEERARQEGGPGGSSRLALLAASGPDLAAKLSQTARELRDGAPVGDPRDRHLGEGESPAGRVCFLFPGQGSQRVNMLRDLVTFLPEHHDVLESADRLLADRLAQPLSRTVYPPPAFGEDERAARQAALDDTPVAQAALAVAGLTAFDVLGGFGLRPHVVAGHSFGEYVALSAAGAIAREDLIRLSEARGRLVAEASASAPGGMLSVGAPAKQVLDHVRRLGLGVELANVNAPDRTVLGGPADALDEAARALAAEGLAARRLPVTAAFHTSAMECAATSFADALRRVAFITPGVRVFSNTHAAPYPESPDEIRALLADHMRRPVRFAEEVLALHDAGARIFFEVGPGTTLTGLVTRTLGDRPHVVLPLEVPGRPGLQQLAHVLARSHALGLRPDLDRFFVHRYEDAPRVDDVLEEARRRAEPAATVWHVDVGRARPVSGSPAAPTRTVAGPRPVAVEGGDALRDVLERLVALQAGQQELTRRLVEIEERTRAGPAPSAPAARVARPVVLPARPVAPSRGAAFPPPGPTRQPVESGAEDEDFVATLLEAVSARTGYPPEMLDLDAHLEGDLGIDSIKRMEILGSLSGFTEVLEASTGGATLQALGSLRTLRSIVDWYEEHRTDGRVDARPPAPETAVRHASTRIGRYVPMTVPTPLDGEASPRPVLDGRLALLLGEAEGWTEALEQALPPLGLDVRTVRHGRAARALGDGAYEVDTTSRSSLEALRDLLLSDGRSIGVAVSLLGLSRAAPGTNGTPLDGPAGLFLFLQAFEPDLRGDGDGTGTRVLNVTAMDGRFGLGGCEDSSLASAGTMGVAKSVAREWPEVRFKCLDVDPHAPPADLAAHVRREIEVWDDAGEVGLRAAGRVTLQLVEDRAPPAAAVGPALPSDAVVLVTGGARGITAEVVRALAVHHRPRLVVVGRSARPGPEPDDFRVLRDAQALRAHLIRARRGLGDAATPADVEREVARVTRAREIRANLDAFESAGATVEYHALDLRDGDAFEALLAQVYARWGRLDGVIHGAGVIADKAVGDKSLDSFRKVFDTKVVPAFVLARALRPEGLRFVLFFSSVSGRFGAPGQCDYSAANEVLNKLANRLGRRWPGVRVASLNWGPWDGGMVTQDIGRFLRSKGIDTIPNARGVALCLDEITRANGPHAEVVLTPTVDAIAAATSEPVPVPPR